MFEILYISKNITVISLLDHNFMVHHETDLLIINFNQLLNDKPEFKDKLNTMNPNKRAIIAELQTNQLDGFISIINELLVANSMKFKFIKLIRIERIYCDTADSDMSGSNKKSIANSINKIIKSSKNNLKYTQKFKKYHLICLQSMVVLLCMIHNDNDNNTCTLNSPANAYNFVFMHQR